LIPDALNLRMCKECYLKLIYVIDSPASPKLGKGGILNATPAMHPNLKLRVDNHTAQNWAMVVTLHNYPILSRECI